MTAAECPGVHVHTPPAYCIGRSGPPRASLPVGSEATDGPASGGDEELIYKTRARREREIR